jgi:hypothetical protein
VAILEILNGSGAMTAAVRRSPRHASRALHSSAPPTVRSTTAAQLPAYTKHAT